jgi:WD repeat-containing protein 17|tara:strand:+ start:254 stop:439 length:186 start_codon:yes stop_codon:yes gene_type:complete
MKMLGTALAKKEDRMLEAANLMIKSGNFEEYCEIQKELGNYEDAISVAPKVSLAYWQKCVD